MKKIRKNKKTPAQLAQQRRFALAVSFLSPLKDIIDEGFKFVAKRKKRFIYPFNLAMSQVLKVAISDISGVPSLDPEKAWLSDGNLPSVSVGDVTHENSRLTVQYFGEATFGSWDDRVRLIAYQVEEGVALGSQVPALRRDNVVTIEIPENLLGKDILLYLLCHERDGLRYARSQYLGTYQIN
ncbi:DUF6266 family protein [Sphingobacterium detergens]